MLSHGAEIGQRHPAHFCHSSSICCASLSAWISFSLLATRCAYVSSPSTHIGLSFLSSVRAFSLSLVASLFPPQSPQAHLQSPRYVPLWCQSDSPCLRCQSWYPPQKFRNWIEQFPLKLLWC